MAEIIEEMRRMPVWSKLPVLHRIHLNIFICAGLRYTGRQQQLGGKSGLGGISSSNGVVSEPDEKGGPLGAGFHSYFSVVPFGDAVTDC